MAKAYSQVVETARQYYNSDDADNFYYHVWGGEDIHIGMYEHDGGAIANASRRTVEKMAGMLPELTPQHMVIDLGSGYGGSARYLARHTGCHVDCINLSETENQRNRQMNMEQGLADRIEVIDANFESVPVDDGTFDVAWSQDAILHSGHREQVIHEVARVLKPGGRFIFTDPMQKNKQKRARDDNVTHRLTRHYSRVSEELEQQRSNLTGKVSDEYIDRMLTGLEHWITAGEKGFLAWGILEFSKHE